MLSETDSVLHAGTKTLNTFLKWQAFEDTQPSKIEIVDITILKPGKVAKSCALDRSLVGYKLQEIRKLVAEDPENPDQDIQTSPDRYFTRVRIDSGLRIIEALESGQTGDLASYIHAASGVKLERVLDDEIQTQLDLVKMSFGEIDAEAKSVRYNPNARAYLQAKTLDIKSYAKRFEDSVKQTADILYPRLGIRSTIPYYSILVKSADEPWLFWAQGDRYRWTSTINAHPRHADKRLPGMDQRLGVHEEVHRTQAAMIRQNLDSGVVGNDIYRITTVPGPEQWLLEGMADSMPLLVPEIYQRFDEYGRFFFQLQLLTRMVTNNLHLDVMAGEKSDVDLIKDYLDLLPVMSMRDADQAISSRRDGYKWPAYHPSYTDGCIFHQRLAKKWENRPDLMQAYLKHATDKLYAKPQIVRWVNSASNSESKWIAAG